MKKLQYFNEIQIMRNGMEPISDSNGSVDTLEKHFICGQDCTIHVVYTVGEDIIYPGGVIRFTIPFGFTEPQIAEPLKPGYTTAHTDNSAVELQPFIIETKWWERGPDRTKIENVSEHVGKHVWVKTSGSSLVKGDTVTLVYGDNTYSDFGRGSACITTGPIQFDVATDVNGRMEAPYSGFYLTKDPAICNGHPEKTCGYEVIIPTSISQAKPFEVTVFARDKYFNFNYEHTGNVCVWVKDKVVKKLHFDKDDCGVIKFEYQTEETEDLIIEVKDEENHTGKSNVGVVGNVDDEEKYFWGDLHGHTGIQWGRGSGNSYYEYGKLVAALDFCSLTDPDAGRYTNNNATVMNSLSCYMSDKQWSSIQEINKNFHEENKFIPILGYEYHNDAPAPEFGGDRNVYFDNYEEYILRCVDQGSYTPGDLWRTLKNKKINAITVPHHTAKKVMLGSWDLHDEDINRLVEIYSCWGNSECDCCERPIIGGAEYEKHSVQYALNKGYRLGFVAGSDTHAGNPGYAHWVFSQHENSYRGGLTCVLTDGLTLPKIFDALKKRKVYATTGERIYLRFEVNGAMMGDEIKYSDNEIRKIRVSVKGTDSIDRIDVVSAGKVIYSYKGSRYNEEFEWTDNRYLKEGWTYYYVRVIQNDKALAWSSPIWVS